MTIDQWLTTFEFEDSAMDEYEKNQWERIKANRFLIVDALERADSDLTPEGWEKDQWGYAYIQLSRAKNELAALMGSVLSCRRRRAAFDGGTYSEPIG